MRITFYFILFMLIITGVSSCSKGDLIKDPAFGSISISDFTSKKVTVIEGENNQLPVLGETVSLLSGNNRFRFYDDKTLLLDTSLKIEPFKKHKYFILRPNNQSVLRVFDDSLNGFNQETFPTAGSVKISLANFSKSLPDKVNVYITTTTYRAPATEEIKVGEILKVSGSFSGFKTMLTGKDQFLKPIKEFTLTIKDSNDQAVLFTVPLVLPVETATVYLLYLEDKTGVTKPDIRATLLMSK
ncbi:hypothetical protein HDE68_000671 [Pedobacter cryoconitis]|uniref:DUF4397 domain-containing protein n=1 Tax=Pedobacter cryoconitis TaxID=188932 RepID=A0A7W8ZIQ6_9SPHI|nr:hypothetical protein [Pedobacter cryoconitis]MBB5634786.1 hypothetical protein [Pedobacter cryoconitis]